MIFDERTYSLLVVSCSEKFNELVASVLSDASFSPVIYANSITVAKRALLDRSFDLIIVNTPLPDEFGTNFAIDAGHSKTSVCMLVVRDDTFEETWSRSVCQGVFVLTKPLNATILSRSLKWMESAREKLRKVETKATSVEEKMEEIRIVNRAKWLLIEKEKKNEPDAHHFIEKEAMNRCVSRRIIADEIIRKYS